MGQYKARRLTCKDPRVRERYNDLYRPFVQQHHLDSRSYMLQSSITGPMSSAQSAEFEGISSLWSQGIAHATHRCRKLKLVEVDYNPALNLLRNRILALNLHISKLLGSRVGSRYLHSVIVAGESPCRILPLPLL